MCFPNSQMRVCKTFNRKTRKGKIFKVVKVWLWLNFHKCAYFEEFSVMKFQEVYLRDDISCNCSRCTICPPPSINAPTMLGDEPYNKTYLVLDTNVGKFYSVFSIFIRCLLQTNILAIFLPFQLVLHQMDLLEQDKPPLCNIIILQTGRDHSPLF